jgi:WD40 repeat protein
MPEPADHTATLAPRDAPTVPSTSPPTPRREVVGPAAPQEGLPVDDPDRYEQIGEHARGGLGRVVRAVDRRLGRTVAVKELLRHDEWHEARFVREALITARLEHPGIVPVHEAGRWPNGDPYYVMKLVEGRTLKELFASTASLRERLALLSHVIAIADAVGYAHSEGVIHRDLKPSNVIVGAFGETIVIDWGLACDRKQALPELAQCTAEGSASGSGSDTISGKVVGTPAYMAPEQARGEPVDERADVYAIGAILYELLSGRAPHADVTPQAVLDRVIAGPPAPIGRIAPGVPPELADLVAKAMERNPADRYSDARALADDLRRYTTGKLVSAHAYTPWQIVRKKLAQHRGAVAVALASTIALAAIGIESFRTVVAERDVASAARSRAEDATRTEQARTRELLLLQAETSLRKDPTAALAWLKQYRTGPQDLPQVVDVVDEALSLGVARHVFRPGDWVFHSKFTPDGKSVVSAVRDATVRRYDLATGAMTVLGRGPSSQEMIAISPDGSLAVTGGGLGEVIVWPLHGGGQRTLVERGRSIKGVQFDAAGKRVLVDRDGGPDEIVDLDGKVTSIGPANSIVTAVADHDWSRAATLVEPNQISVIEGETTRKIAETERKISALWLSPSGQEVFAADGTSVWSVPYAGGPLRKLATYPGKYNSISWSPDGKTMALNGTRTDVVLVDIVSGAVTELRGHTDAIYTAEFTRDGQHLLSASDDGTARLWDLADVGSSRVLRGHDDDVYSAYFSPDERSVVTSSLDGSVRVWPLDRDGTRELAEGKSIDLMTLTGDTVLVTTHSSLARWDLATGERTPLFDWGSIPGTLGTGLPSPDGEALLVPYPDRTLEVRRRNGPSVILRGHKGLVKYAEWLHGSDGVVTSSVDGTMRRWNTKTGESTILVQGDVTVRQFAVAADGRVAAQIGDRLVMINPDGTSETIGGGSSWCSMWSQFESVRDRLIVQRCDHTLLLRDGERLVELPTNNYQVTRIAVSPDGELIAAAMNDRTVRVWNSAGKVLYTLRGHNDLVMDVAFSPDGKQLASSSYDRTVRVWQLGTPRHRVLRGHAGPVTRVAWRGAGQLVSASADGTLRLWHVPDTALPTQDEMSSRLEAATTASIDHANRATTQVN